MKSPSCLPLEAVKVICVSESPIDSGAALSQFQKAAATSGGIVSFTGNVRGTSAQGSVTTLHLQSYSPLTEQGIASAAQTARGRWPLDHITILHRTGDMRPGDTIVFVAAASAHRRAAFEAADFLMDYLKTEAVFWKKETTSEGTAWIEPRAEDYQDNARWANTETT